MNPINFTITLPPVTKKNSSRIVIYKNKPMLLPSKAFTQYQKDAGWFIPCRHLRIDYPVNIKACYYMATNRKVDISNLHSALCDVLVHYGILADDSSLNPCIVAGMDGSRVYYDKYKPRTEVEIARLT